jgi:hypothetical protein
MRTRNFSHPNCQRASLLSPEHSQDNPPLTVNDSRYMLPILPSGILRSTSTQSLQTEQDRHTDFDFGYKSPARPEKSHATFSARSVLDLNATALPPMPTCDAPPIPPIPLQYAAPTPAPPPVTINQTSSTRSIRSTHHSPRKSGKIGKGSRLDRWSMRVKTVFRFKRHKKSPVPAVLPFVMDDSDSSGPATDIGLPAAFQHVSSNTVHHLRAPGTGLFASPHWRAPVRSGKEMRSVMMSGGLGISGLDQPSSSSHDAALGPSGAGPSEGNTYAELGQQDADDAAVSEDGNSEWEDDEGSRLFLKLR